MLEIERFDNFDEWYKSTDPDPDEYDDECYDDSYMLVSGNSCDMPQAELVKYLAVKFNDEFIDDRTIEYFSLIYGGTGCGGTLAYAYIRPDELNKIATASNSVELANEYLIKNRTHDFHSDFSPEQLQVSATVIGQHAFIEGFLSG